MDAVDRDVDLDSHALEQLHNLDSKTLLDTIDSLRALQLNDIAEIDLPQIIVVGDQSAGKSSVLEAISRVRFPVEGEVCTRFATELALRRADDVRVEVSIQYADRSVLPAEPFRRTGFDKDSLPNIINEAKERMGIRAGVKGFSKDILRVEISGPDVYSLTLVDLPGFFHSETADQSPEDKILVHQLVEGYMKQKKSIILAVVAANYNLSNQIVLQKAATHDPTRERTIGVITKPDLAGHKSNAEKHLQFAKGKEARHQLKLGYFVLRNRAEDEEVDFDTRDRNELRFFQSGVWNSVPKSHQGVEHLRKRLSEVLLNLVKGNLPGLIREIDQHLVTRKEGLKRLGQRRSGSEEQKLYLHAIAQNFYDLARDGVEGRYNHGFFGDVYKQDRKLRAALRKLNRAFDTALSTKGAAYEISSDDTDEDDASEDDSAERVDNTPDYLRPYIDLYKEFADPEPITETQLRLKIERLAADNAGKDLPGAPNSALALQIFVDQSQPWREIARCYLSWALRISKAFVEEVFGYVVGSDDTTRVAILSHIVDPFFDERRDVLEGKLDEVIRPYTNSYALPLEAEFHKKMSKSAVDRLAEKLAVRLEEDHPEAFEERSKTALSRKKIIQSILSVGEPQTSEFGTEKVIDMMIAYYDVSLRFLWREHRRC
jgi:GTP-binding protein EngB required for normal cell division